jgi:DNA-binding winged helix-turn-helix (wHTH) protein/Tfp pilus assembly protein PilF
MTSPAHRGRVFRFGVFEAFADSRELFRQGRRVRMQDQPFQLLLLLLESPGEIVDREFLRDHLWPENTFVDFSQSLGTAVTKLRQALGDDADNPRFVETIPRRGYRFIAPVTLLADTAKPAPQGSSPLSVQPPLPTPSARKKWALLSSLAIAVLGIGAFTAYSFHRLHNTFVLAPQDTIILADFENTTGEAIFNDTLRQGLLVGLAQSPLVHVMPDRAAAVIFRQMGHAPDDRMTGRIAIDLCRRVGGKVTVQGSISSLGTAYLLGLAAIRCDTGKPIAYEHVEAAQREDVVGALGKATAQLRARLGESLPSIRKYNAPLEQATTSSLEALSAYGLALSTWDAKGDFASVPYFKRAIEIDPNFAVAYGGLAVVYSNMGETQLARENTIKAYQLRNRVTEVERASIDARYYLYVTGEIDKAALTYQVMAQDYPDSPGTLNHLATSDLKLGHDVLAVESFRRALLLDATRSATYGNLAFSLLRLNRVQEARSVLAAAEKRGLRTGFLLQVEYWVAFLDGNQNRMDGVVSQAAQIPGAQSLLLTELAKTEAFHGRFEKASSLSSAAANLMIHDSDKESAASVLAQSALREAEVGSAQQARSLIQQAGKINDDTHVAIITALVAAETGDDKQALALAAALDKRYPDGTFVQTYWLPLIRAEMDLRHGKAANAVRLLSVTVPLDSAIADNFSMTALYPNYVRGQAYLAAGDGNKAGDEFQKLLDHTGMVLNSTLGALAHLGRARAYALAGRPQQARTAYRDFFALWKDADPTIPVLRQAKAESHRLDTTP